MGEQLPSPGLYVSQDLINTFNTVFDQLLVDVSNPLKLFFPPTASGCPSCFSGPDGRSNGVYNTNNPFPLNTLVDIGGKQRVLNRSFAFGQPCPVCRGSHQILTENSATYSASIQPSPKDINYDALGISPANVYRTKTQVFALEDIRRAKYARIFNETCVMLREPVKTGLKEKRYIKTFWIKQD